MIQRSASSSWSSPSALNFPERCARLLRHTPDWLNFFEPWTSTGTSPISLMLVRYSGVRGSPLTKKSTKIGSHSAPIRLSISATRYALQDCAKQQSRYSATFANLYDVMDRLVSAMHVLLPPTHE